MENLTKDHMEIIELKVDENKVSLDVFSIHPAE